MDTKRHLEDLTAMSDRELEAIFEGGTTPDFDKLFGWEFRGMNQPFFTKLMGIKKFTKGFYKKTGRPFGYNIPIKQKPDGWSYKPTDEDPKRYGFYTVKPVDPDSEENKHEHALLLNYGEGENPFWGFTWILRDYIVKVDPDNDDLYLGKAYTVIGPLRLPPSFFIIERYRESKLKEA